MLKFKLTLYCVVVLKINFVGILSIKRVWILFPVKVLGGFMTFIKNDFNENMDSIVVNMSYFETMRYYKNQMNEAIKRLELLQEEVVYVPQSFREHLMGSIDEQQKYVDYLKRTFNEYKEIVVIHSGENNSGNIKES